MSEQTFKVTNTQKELSSYQEYKFGAEPIPSNLELMLERAESRHGLARKVWIGCNKMNQPTFRVVRFEDDFVAVFCETAILGENGKPMWMRDTTDKVARTKV